MPFVENRGQRIHYSVEGQGPLVVFQHGLFDDRRGWKDHGFVDALADHYQVACVNSLGHGQSGKPADPAFYAQPLRAGDIVAVIDELGSERAHVVGYSMGGWIAVGVAKYFPERLASLVVGGWDPVGGLDTARRSLGLATFQFDGLVAMALARTPDLVEQVTPQTEPGFRACFEQLSDLDGAAAAVLSAGVPVLLWAGRSDPYHDAMRAFAQSHGLQFLAVNGDHLGARRLARESPTGVRAFIDAVCAGKSGG